MNGFEDIEKKIKNIGRKTTPDTDQRILGDATVSLEQVPRTSPAPAASTLILRAAAAVIMVLVILGLVFVFTRPAQPPKEVARPSVITETIPEPPKELVVSEPNAEHGRSEETVKELQSELEKVIAFSKAGDVNGLLAVLDEGSVPAKMLAANYLAQIGDLRVAQILEDLAAELTPDEPNSVFAVAAAQIKNRLGIAIEEAVVAEPNLNSQFEFEPRGVLSGLITDAETGEPVTDALVQISIRRVYDTKTDANGFYYFDDLKQDGNYRLRIYSKEYIGITDYDDTQRVNLNIDTKTVKHFQLERACMIEVQVVDEADKPVEKARVSVSLLADRYGRDVSNRLYTSVTDANGLITLGGLEPTDAGYLLTATHSVKAEWITEDGQKKYKSEWDYAPGHLTAVLKDTNSVEFGRILLKKGTEVRGYAEYEDGVPASDLKISAYPQWWYSGTSPQSYEIDPNGYFTLKQILPGSYRLQVIIPTGQGSAIGVSLHSVDLPPEDGELLIVKIPRKSPQSLVSISGRITFIGSEKPQPFDISAYSARHGHSSTYLSYGPDGEIADTFTVGRLEPGKYRLTFQGSNIEQLVLEDVEAPIENLEIELVCSPKPKFEGTVIDKKSQKPVAKFRARLRKLRTLRGANYAQSDAWTTFENSDGRFEIETVGPGIYQVQIEAPGYARLWSREVNTDANETVLIELTEGGRITGKVIDEKSIPIAGVKVIPLSIAGGSMWRTKDTFVSENGAVETDSQGRFVLEQLPAGTETLKAVHPDYTFTIVGDIKVQDGQTTEGIEIVLTRGGAVEGYVYDHHGRPQPGVSLYFQDERGYGGDDDEKAGRLATVVTDANGYYRVAGLPEKICYAVRQRQWDSLGVISLAIVPQNGRTSRLDFGPKPVIAGRIVIDGEPLVSSSLILTGIDNPNSEIFKNRTRTDSSGAFRFFGAPVGIYAIYYESPSKRSEWLKATTVQVGFADIDLGNILEQMLSIEVLIQTQDPNLTVKRLFLTEGDEHLARHVGNVVESDEPNQPYEVTGLLPGTYSLSILRSDNVMIRREIEVDRNEKSVTVEIPKGSSSISGNVIGMMRNWTVWRDDKQVVATTQPDPNGYYEIENLPAGRYHVGGNILIEEGIFINFELADGQHKELDIDYAGLDIVSKAWLHVVIMDENGVPICGAKASLRGSVGIIEPMMNTSQGLYFSTTPGDYELLAAYPGFTEASRPVTLTTSKEKPEMTFIRLKRQP